MSMYEQRYGVGNGQEDYEWENDSKIASYKIRQKIGEPSYIIFKVEQDENSCVDSLDMIPVLDKVILIADKTHKWGGDKSRKFYSRILDKPTWLDLAVVAHEQMKTTLDLTHQYIVGIEQLNVVTIGDEIVKECRLELMTMDEINPGNPFDRSEQDEATDPSICLDVRHKTKDYVWKKKSNIASFLIEKEIGEPSLIYFDIEKADKETLKQVPVKGSFIITAKSDSLYGGEKAKSYRSTALTNPTWLEIGVIAHQQMKTTLDTIHKSIEGIDPKGNTIDNNGNSVKEYELSLIS